MVMTEPSKMPGRRSSAGFQLPDPMRQLLARLPAWPGSVLFVTGLNLLVAPGLPADVRQQLAGRPLRIQVRDAGVAFDFAWQGQAFAALGRQTQAPALVIAANAVDFWALARREQDPDTLFFSRRLVMEGDTELGLLVKNTLDAMEMPVLDPRQLRLPSPLAVLAGLRQALRPGSERAARPS